MEEIRADARAQGMVTLNEYAGYLLRNGLTTPSEVLRVLEVQS